MVTDAVGRVQPSPGAASHSRWPALPARRRQDRGQRVAGEHRCVGLIHVNGNAPKRPDCGRSTRFHPLEVF